MHEVLGEILELQLAAGISVPDAYGKQEKVLDQLFHSGSYGFVASLGMMGGWVGWLADLSCEKEMGAGAVQDYACNLQL